MEEKETSNQVLNLKFGINQTVYYINNRGKVVSGTVKSIAATEKRD